MYKLIFCITSLWFLGGFCEIIAQETDETTVSAGIKNSKKRKKSSRKGKSGKKKNKANDSTPEENPAKPPYIRVELKNYLKSPGITLKSKKVLDELLEILPAYADLSIVVEGHTSNFNFLEDREESLEEGQDRSQKHADMVKDYMINRGFSNELIVSEGYGASQPKIVGYDKKNRPVLLLNTTDFAKMSNERIILQIDVHYPDDLKELKRELRRKDIEYKTRAKKQ